MTRWCSANGLSGSGACSLVCAIAGGAVSAKMATRPAISAAPAPDRSRVEARAHERHGQRHGPSYPETPGLLPTPFSATRLSFFGLAVFCPRR